MYACLKVDTWSGCVMRRCGVVGTVDGGESIGTVVVYDGKKMGYFYIGSDVRDLEDSAKDLSMSCRS